MHRTYFYGYCLPSLSLVKSVRAVTKTIYFSEKKTKRSLCDPSWIKLIFVASSVHLVSETEVARDHVFTFSKYATDRYARRE